MGQWSRALPLLERALEQAPDHIPALTAKGQALFKAGHANAAVTTWQRALELSGGENSQVEELLRQVPEGTAPGAESAATRNG
jgi:Flp pilus assembly protein TadD